MKRERLSLETTADFKREVSALRRKLGTKSIIATLRTAVRIARAQTDRTPLRPETREILKP